VKSDVHDRCRLTRAEVVQEERAARDFLPRPAVVWTCYQQDPCLRIVEPIHLDLATSRSTGQFTANPVQESANPRASIGTARSVSRGEEGPGGDLVALVRAGAVFVNGKLVERPGEDAPPEAA
jgi:hypothetical protein